jgi:hypothetical protein
MGLLGSEGSEKCGVRGHEEVLLKFDVAVVANTLTDILLRKLVMYSSGGVPDYPNSRHNFFRDIRVTIVRGFKGKALTSAPFE